VLTVAAGFLLSTGSTARGEQNCSSPSLLSQLRWARFDVVGGRLTVRSARPVSGNTHVTGNPDAGIRESLAVSAAAAGPHIRYERVLPREELLIEFSEGQCVTIRLRREAEQGTSSLGFEQPARGSLRLEWKPAGESATCLVADSLWHLLLAHPRLCREHLLPLLRIVRPDWRLPEQARRVEESLLNIARSGWLPDEARWSAWVGQLGSADFQQRQAADLRLRAAGQAVLPFLESLDPERLDAEQRLRIRRISESLDLQREDQPQRVALWLAADPLIWVALLAHEDGNKRELAARRLAMLSGRQIEFDPHAEPQLRERQIRQVSDLLAVD
jgi:hypothetical protein